LTAWRGELAMDRTETPAVTTKQVACQAVSDWFGKEVQNGYTVTYVWMTNQLGHFTLGFLFTFLVVWAAELVHAHVSHAESLWLAPGDSGAIAPGDFRGWMLLIPALEVLVWVVKEARDCIIAVRDAKGNPFRFDLGDVLKDALTAVWFISVGIAVAYLSFVSWLAAWIVFVAGLAIALVPAKYWLSRKMCFQQADAPFLFRLADFNSVFAPSPAVSVQDIEAYADGDAALRHLLIFGETSSGRTSLAAAIVTEHTFLVRSGRYMTWAKFIENAQGPEPAVQDGAPVWPWRKSDIVVLDDVVKVIDGKPITAPAEIADNLRLLSPEARRALAERRTVWVLGPGGRAEMSPDRWIEALATSLGASPDDFGCVELIQGSRRKPRVPFAQFSGH
jgi:hypothetical protein